MTRLAIVWPYLPSYRVDFCEQAQRALGRHGIDLRVYTGRADNDRSDERTAEWHEVVPEVRVDRPARLRLRRLPRDADLLIVEQAIKNLESFPAVAAQHVGGPPVAFWGHGRSYSTPQGRPLAAVKQWLTRRGHWFFVYTHSGANYLVTHGFPATRITVLNNASDTVSIRSGIDAVGIDDLKLFAHEKGLTPGMTALFLGGVDQHKDINFLLEVAREGRRLDSRFVLLVAGTGDQFRLVEADERGGGAVRALGRCEGEPLATALASSNIMMIPSAVGLVAVDSLAAGLPIVTRNNLSHGPEADYLVDGHTSVWLPADCSPLEYATAAVGLLRDSRRLSDLTAQCLLDGQHYRLDAMVDAFVGGVLSWRDIEQARL